MELVLRQVHWVGLLAHFPETEFDQIRIPFTDSIEKVEDAQKRVANAKDDDWIKTYRYYVYRKRDPKERVKSCRCILY